eukprot:463329_1
MSSTMLSFFLVIVCIYKLSNASMVVQSCVKNINVANLATSDTNNPYPTGPNTFKISIVIDSESPIDTSFTTLSGGSASFPTKICFDFDSSNPSFTPIISYNPIRGRSITFNIMGNGNTFGSVTTLFPHLSFGSNKTAFITDTLSVQPISTFDGTITFSIYHQIKTSNVYLKIANRNFNVYRQCFKMKRLCIYPGGIENPIYPNDCIALTNANIEVNPNENGLTDENNLLDNNDSNIWQSTPTPTSAIPTGPNMQKCWAPYSQYIIVDLATIGVTAISSISLGFTADPSLKHSGDTTEIPPRWITFAFDSVRNDLVSATSDVDTDQYWAVDLQGGNFKSEGSSGTDQFVWTINPLYFQYDTKPAANAFRMTQITQGFGLQYLVNTDLQYKSASRTTWNTYAATYIDPLDVNTGTNGTYQNQVKQLGEIACKNIFPLSSPNYIADWDQSNTYNACWNYAPTRDYECYGDFITDPPNPDGDVFFPPVAYLLRQPAFTFLLDTTPYCTDPFFIPNDWSGCNSSLVGDLEQQRCMITAINPISCHADNVPLQGVPMGWRCIVPT